MNILIVKTSSLGDIIHAFPVVDYLKGKFPNARIDWVVEKPFGELVRAHPDIERTLCVDTRAWRKAFFYHRSDIRAFRRLLREVEYDYVFDFQGNIKSGLLTMQAKSKNKVGFGWQTVPEWPNMLFTNQHYNPPKGKNIREDYLYIVQKFFRDDQPISTSQVILKTSSADQDKLKAFLDLPHSCKVMVCPGSAWLNKQMTPEALRDFLQLLQPHLQCTFLFVWGTAEEKLFVEKLQSHFPNHSQIVDRMSLPALQNLMTHVNLVIAMDSLPLHLAGTTSTPTFSIFGASLAHKYHPLGAQHRTYQGTCPYQRIFEKRCPVLRTCPTGLCIRALSGEQLFRSFMLDCF